MKQIVVRCCFVYPRCIRLALFAIGISAGTPSFAQAPAAAPGNDPHHVVFVCEHGSAKSLIASLYNLPAIQSNYSLGRDEILKRVDGLIEQLATVARTGRARE